MKTLLLTIFTAVALSACADTRNHITDDAQSWEKVRYQSQESQSKPTTQP
ncbi:MAG: hypothetical protein Q4B82_05930 [Alysiella sp.]|nr:hypothetical protein [Alysiella sp.]MDO4434101.1 hypothetical protein [Alysiella sp.]